MAQAKLWISYSIIRILMMGVLTILLASCRTDDKPVGMTLLFQSAGREVVVQRFDPDGMRGPVPGVVGGMFPRGGAVMSFMPGDSKRGMPKFVDVAWVVPTPEYEEWSKNNQKKRMLNNIQVLDQRNMIAYGRRTRTTPSASTSPPSSRRSLSPRCVPTVKTNN